MTRDDMLKRLAEGENPLDVSIAKWEWVCENSTMLSTGKAPHLLRAGNCALCEAFYSISKEGCCKQCPIVDILGGHCCDRGSAWREVMFHRGDPEELFLQSAKKMLSILEEARDSQKGEING